MAAKQQAKTSGGASAPSLAGKKPVPDIPDLPIGAAEVRAIPDRDNVEVGDIVIYAHRRGIPDVNGKDYTEIPMMVTRVYNAVTIGGVVFSESAMLCPEGCKRVDPVSFGKGGGTWRPRA